MVQILIGLFDVCLPTCDAVPGAVANVHEHDPMLGAELPEHARPAAGGRVNRGRGCRFRECGGDARERSTRRQPARQHQRLLHNSFAFFLTWLGFKFDQWGWCRSVLCIVYLFLCFFSVLNGVRRILANVFTGNLIGVIQESVGLRSPEGVTNVFTVRVRFQLMNTF